MDQIKDILAKLKKHHFWVLCGLSMLVGLISWYVAKSGLDRQTASNVQQIKAKDSEIKGVLSFSPHPNDSFIQGMEQIISPQSYQVALAWKKRYEQQEKYLKWPETLIRDAPGFDLAVEKLRPIEKLPYPTPKDKEISSKFLNVYRNFITSELPRLAETIGAKWHLAAPGSEGSSSTPKAGGIYGPPGGAFSGDSASGQPGVEVDRSIVYWAEDNQTEIVVTHFGFASRNQNPTTLEVLYAQEDLWVLQALMAIIKKTNGDVDTNFDAAIKEISSLQIGRTARGRMGRIMPITDRTTDTGGPPGVGAGAMTAPGSSAGPGGGAPAAQPDAAETADPAFERYVDVNYEPLKPALLRTAATSTDPATAIYAVAKRIPVRMRLLIDQRRLKDLLGNCGNHDIPVEIRQVRVNAAEGAVSGDPGMGGGRGGGEFGGMVSGGGGASRSSSRRGRPSDAPPDYNELPVEVYGIVYIYNPVNEQMLGVEMRNTVEAAADKGAASPTAGLPAATSAR